MFVVPAIYRFAGVLHVSKAAGPPPATTMGLSPCSGTSRGAKRRDVGVLARDDTKGRTSKRHSLPTPAHLRGTRRAEDDKGFGGDGTAKRKREEKEKEKREEKKERQGKKEDARGVRAKEEEEDGATSSSSFRRPSRRSSCRETFVRSVVRKEGSVGRVLLRKVVSRRRAAVVALVFLPFGCPPTRRRSFGDPRTSKAPHEGQDGQVRGPQQLRGRIECKWTLTLRYADARPSRTHTHDDDDDDDDDDDERRRHNTQAIYLRGPTTTTHPAPTRRTTTGQALAPKRRGRAGPKRTAARDSTPGKRKAGRGAGGACPPLKAGVMSSYCPRGVCSKRENNGGRSAWKKTAEELWPAKHITGRALVAA